jgi:hypothetical protein
VNRQLSPGSARRKLGCRGGPMSIAISRNHMYDVSQLQSRRLGLWLLSLALFLVGVSSCGRSDSTVQTQPSPSLSGVYHRRYPAFLDIPAGSCSGGLLCVFHPKPGRWPRRVCDVWAGRNLAQKQAEGSAEDDWPKRSNPASFVGQPKHRKLSFWTLGFDTPESRHL